MADHRFLILLADFKDKQPDADVLVKQLNKAKDWIRLSPSSWLLFTSNGPETWYTRFRRVSEEGRVFITQVEASQRSGYMPKSVWEFMRKHQEQIDEE